MFDYAIIILSWATSVVKLREKYACSKEDHVVKMQTNNPQYSVYYLQLLTIDHASKQCAFIEYKCKFMKYLR